MSKDTLSKPSAARPPVGTSTTTASPGGPGSLEKELLERQGPGPLIDRPVSATAAATANAADQRDKMDAFAKRSTAKRRQRQSSNSQLNVANKQHAELEQLPLLKGKSSQYENCFSGTVFQQSIHSFRSGFLGFMR